MRSQIPLTRDLVLVGGGHTHALVLRMWGMSPLPGVRLTLISPGPTAAYSGMLPGHVAGHYCREALQIDLVKLARHAGARLILGCATEIDRSAQRVTVPGRAPVAYDVLSLDIGITSDMPSLPGFAEHAVPAKPLDVFADRWQAYVEAARTGNSGTNVAVIGGGIAGVELALAARHRLGDDARVTVIEAADALTALGRGARKALLAHLENAGIRLLTHTPVIGIDSGRVRLCDGRSIASDFTIGAAGARAARWLASSGLASRDGFITVDETLRSTSDPAIFAAGDIADLAHAPRPKAGVYAVRQMPVLRHNLTVSLTGQGRMRAFKPQSDYLKLISTGGKGAVADKWGLPLNGRWLWRLKDRIDRKFMRKFTELPVMPLPGLPKVVAQGVREELGDGKPLCGGCGAKVGLAGLKAAIAGLPAPRRCDVLSGPGDDAAVLVCGKGYQVITTDHVRAFSLDPWLFAKITAIHAMGDVWAMGARPQSALAQVILPRMSARLQSETLREIMAAASGVFAAAGADVVGGHSSLGSELTVGFTVTGLCEKMPIGQSGALPGDVLILTKAIGTGVILAAEMARAAPGRAVAAAIASMGRPLMTSSAILAPLAHAMTDVTGFGLAGHLLGMLEASGVAATIDLDAIPVLQGAETLAAAGHGSTLLPANRLAAARMTLTASPRSDLLFDPQTAGGLLACVPLESLDAVSRRMAEADEAFAVIGKITKGTPFLTVIG
ncbi:MAG: selenide, water dikinase SelD [Rhodobacteraceae bacterium]|nr:selenide, water dikinase SelD [Paracoccaceae bacterium]MCP5342797.1 selenide, water dikinase SelD [Paracoccaceae bacterium]